jgi:hypothetical protein
MSRTRKPQTLSDKFPPSRPCRCEICLGYCLRPGWWTVEQGRQAVEAGYARRMMLEMAADHAFGVLSPAFKGCEISFALDLFASRGCTFLQDGLCELYGTGLQPLECRYCHHDRRKLGFFCHQELARDWNTPAGRALVVHWSKISGFWSRRVSSTFQKKK